MDNLPKAPVDFAAWIERVKPELKPPVGNKLLFGEGQLKVMVVGGPNVRKDYHMEVGEEFFYQILGDMRLDIMDRGQRREVVIKEGEVFMLPGRIPHSPQRFPNTIGLVIERERTKDEIDGLRWYVNDTNQVLYEEWFHCEDLGVQLKPVIERFFASQAYKTQVPEKEYNKPELQLDEQTSPSAAFNLRAWIDEKASLGANVLFDGEFTVIVEKGEGRDWEKHHEQIYFHQLQGSVVVNFRNDETGEVCNISLGNNDVYLLPKGNISYKTERSSDSVGMVITNKKTL